MCSGRQRHTKGILSNERFVMFIAAQQNHSDADRGAENGAICLFFEKNAQFQEFCIQKPAAYPQKTEASLHFANYLLVFPLFARESVKQCLSAGENR
jgi:hypothetical protein